MDADSPEARRTPASGGTLAPANGSTRNPRRDPGASAEGVRYELRDPFAEVTYRSTSLEKISQHAQRLGAVRFHAVDPDGTRSPVEKVGDRWQRVDRDAATVTDRTADSPHTGAKAGEAPAIDKVVAQIEAEAARATHLQRIEEALHERYIIKRPLLTAGDLTLGHTEYRFRGDLQRIAFTESSTRLSTDSNNPTVARSMVDVAEARQWQTVRVSGHEDFRRMVWLEASLRGVQTLGYEPQAADLNRLHQQRGVRQANRISPTRAPSQASDGSAKRPSARGSGGRKAVLAALEAVLVARGVPVKQRDAVMTAAKASLSERLRAGESHKVKILDKTAPTRQATQQPTGEVQRSRDRPGPGR